jgi:hypothetical protein
LAKVIAQEYFNAILICPIGEFQDVLPNELAIAVESILLRI